jgi:hypothetical protein
MIAIIFLFTEYDFVQVCKELVPKKGLPTALLWNFPVFVVRTLLYNGIGLAQ